jgi:galactitol-specific phosphotransferase system IIC component
LYGYYTEIFEPKFFNYNLSLWSALIVNIVLAIFSIISLRGPKLLPILGIIVTPISTYLFYVSWTELNYMYLAGFIIIPVILLSVATLMKFYEKESRREVVPQRAIPPEPQHVAREGIGTNY